MWDLYSISFEVLVDFWWWTMPAENYEDFIHIKKLLRVMELSLYSYIMLVVATQECNIKIL